MSKKIAASSLILLGLALMFSFQNCGKPSELNYASSVDLTSQSGLQTGAIQILSKNCAECHNPANVNGNVSDITNVNYLMYTRLVVPGEPELSPLILQITKGLMPKGRPFLSNSEVEILKSWVAGLAPDLQGPGGTLVTVPLDGTFRSLNANIFAPKCAACHRSGAGANSNVRFDTFAQATAVANMGLVVNGTNTPTSSRLYVAVTRTTNRMPQNGTALTETELSALRAWLAKGAPND